MRLLYQVGVFFLLVGLLSHPAFGQTVHDETIVWNFKNGLRVQGVPIGAAGAAAPDQVFVSDAPGQGTWRTLPSCPSGLGYNAVTNTFACGTAGVSIGSLGVFQAANGSGGFAAYAGSTPCANGLFMTALSATGTATCDTPVSPSSTAHLLTDRSETLVPNAINLAALSSGLVLSTVSGGIATITTVAVPGGTGGLVGVDASQLLTNKEVVARTMTAPTDTSPLRVNVDTTDIVVVSDLLQATLFENPIGTGREGRWIRFRVHSSTPRALTWDTAWSAESGIPLPTTTTAGTTYDLFVWQYNANTSKWTIIYNSQLLALRPSGVEANTYTCPTLTVDTFGRITAASDGVCGGGSGTPAGVAGDVQLSDGAAFAADTGVFRHDSATHITYMQSFQAGQGGGFLGLLDVGGTAGLLVAEPLTTARVWSFPDITGTIGVGNFKTTGAATGKKVVCADVSTGQLYVSSTSTDCSD